ncbi:MAG: pilus assembly protein TadG-related protein [Acidimicrobiales bacterium]
MAARREHGQTLPLMALVIVLIAATLVVVSRVGVLVVDRSRAHAAADAAALAAIHGGRPAAIDVATRNHGTLVSYVELNGSVEVRVRVGRATALARAAPAKSDPSG